MAGSACNVSLDFGDSRGLCVCSTLSFRYKRALVRLLCFPKSPSEGHRTESSRDRVLLHYIPPDKAAVGSFLPAARLTHQHATPITSLSPPPQPSQNPGSATSFPSKYMPLSTPRDTIFSRQITAKSIEITGDSIPSRPAIQLCRLEHDLCGPVAPAQLVRPRGIIGGKVPRLMSDM
jgi:hypothetical protein